MPKSMANDADFLLLLTVVDVAVKLETRAKLSPSGGGGVSLTAHFQFV